MPEQYERIFYDPPCFPTGMRYKPKYLYGLPYGVTCFAYTDHLHGKSAIYYPNRDKGVVEITLMKEGQEALVKKRFHIDYTTWYKQDLGYIEAVDMSFGYDYQRLFVLYKQNLSNGKTYRSWLSMYDTNMPHDCLVGDPFGIPLYGFIRDDVHLHPFVPDNLKTILDYIKVCGLTGKLINRPELRRLFNIMSAHDKLFVTLPVLFMPRRMPWDKEESRWIPEDARCLYQVLFMFDETAGTFESAAIIGAISTWNEDWRTPYPDIVPRMPFKHGMSIMDDQVLWRLSDLRVFPKEWYEDGETKEDNPNVWYMKTMWDAAKLPDRYWQPLQMETIYIDDLINAMREHGTAYLRPLVLRGQQYYCQSPLASDLYPKVAADWSGQRVMASYDHSILEYGVKYHNFKRKIITDITVKAIEHIEEVPFHLDFQPSGKEYEFKLPPGKYTLKMRGADGGPLTVEDKVTKYGGVAATLESHFEITREMQGTATVGYAGSCPQAGQIGGGNGGDLVPPPPEPQAPRFDDILKNGEARTFDQYKGSQYFFRVPKGVKNLKLVLDNICENHNISLQVFKPDGTLLTGTPHTGKDQNLWACSLYDHDGYKADPYYGGTPYPTTNPKEITQRCLTEANGFDLGASFDDSKVNGTGQPVFKKSSSGLQTFDVGGETIRWTGSKYGHRVSRFDHSKGVDASQQYQWWPDVDQGASLSETLEMDEVSQDLIFGYVGFHTVTMTATWDADSLPPPPEPPEAEKTMHGGGGGGLTSLLLMGTPIAVAGSGGGAGSESAQSTASPGDTTGGHGGGVEGLYGLLNSMDQNAGGTQTSGWQMFRGQSATGSMCPAGGGGAGFYGGVTTVTEGQTFAGGGGGGSSFVLGADGYNPDMFTLMNYTLENYTVTPGSGSAGSAPQNGYIEIDGVYYKKTYTYEPIYQFCDHELGDFYYQCAGFFVTPEKSTLPPDLPPELKPWVHPTCPSPDPITIPGEPPLPIPLPKYDVPPPSVPPKRALDIIFLADMSASMDSYVRTIGASMKDFVKEMEKRGYTDNKYGFGVYNDMVLKAAVTESPNYMTKSGDKLAGAFKNARDLAGRAGAIESGSLAMRAVFNTVKPELRNPDGVGGAYKATYFIMITDEPSDDDDPTSGGYNWSNTDKAREAQSKWLKECKDRDISVHWIVPEDDTRGLGDPGTVMRKYIDETQGSLIKEMKRTHWWGKKAAIKIADAIETTDDSTGGKKFNAYSDWLFKYPGDPPDPNLALGIIRFDSHPPFKTPAPEKQPKIPGYTVFHTFALENLSCNTWLNEVYLKATDKNIKLGLLSQFDPNDQYPIKKPDKDRLDWEDIRPHSEVLFTVYADIPSGPPLLEGLDFGYYQEMRNSDNS